MAAAAAAAPWSRHLQDLGASRMQSAAPCGWDRHAALNTPSRSSTTSRVGREVLMARTHGGSMSSSRSTATTLQCPTPSAPSRSRFGDRSSSLTVDPRLNQTAPARPIAASAVEEATGVRLSDSQLQVLRMRYQGGCGIMASCSFGDGPTSSDLRREVFGGIVLKPGQWPRVAADDASSCGGKTLSGRHTPVGPRAETRSKQIASVPPGRCSLERSQANRSGTGVPYPTAVGLRATGSCGHLPRGR